MKITLAEKPLCYIDADMLNWHGLIHSWSIKTWKGTWNGAEQYEQHLSVLYTAALWTQIHLLLFTQDLHLIPQTNTGSFRAATNSCHLQDPWLRQLIGVWSHTSCSNKILEKQLLLQVPQFHTTKQEYKFGEVTTTNAPLRVHEVLIRRNKKSGQTS